MNGLVFTKSGTPEPPFGAALGSKPIRIGPSGSGRSARD